MKFKYNNLNVEILDYHFDISHIYGGEGEHYVELHFTDSSGSTVPVNKEQYDEAQEIALNIIVDNCISRAFNTW